VSETYIYDNPVKKTWDKDAVVTFTFPEETTIEDIEKQVDGLVKLADNNKLFTFDSHCIDIIEIKVDNEDDI